MCAVTRIEVDAAASLLAELGGGNVFVLYTVIVWASVLLSDFIDNIPYVATMLPVVTGLAEALGIPPTLLYFGLLSRSASHSLRRQSFPHTFISGCYTAKKEGL